MLRSLDDVEGEVVLDGARVIGEEVGKGVRLLLPVVVDGCRLLDGRRSVDDCVSVMLSTVIGDCGSLGVHWCS